MNINIAFILSSIAGFSTLIGAFVIFFSDQDNEKFLIAGISFASSVMLFLSLFDLIPESVHFFEDKFIFGFSVLLSILFLCFGVCISLIIDKLFPNSFDNDALYKLGVLTSIGIIFHNIPEGIATFITTSHNIRLGVSISIAIAMHNIPEGIGIALPIYYSTKSYFKAFFYTFICAISEPFGALIAYLFLHPTSTILGLVYAIIAGIMIHISIYELLPSAIKYKRYRITYLFYTLGIIVVFINILLF